MKRLLSATALALLMAGPALARENYAILVGASDYDNLDERYWLTGPANDVALVDEFLLSNPGAPFEKDNIIVLADGIEGARRATLQAIRDAFAKVAEEAQPGDFVYLHFSGHGTQAPAIDPSTELDGLDEMFLPVDIGAWTDSVGTVPNALVDDEIGQLIDSIRAKGANVWVVFDSCHSGTATRGAPDDDVAFRMLPPEALGISSDAIRQAEDEAAADNATRGVGDDPRAPAPPPVEIASEDGMGSLVAFFAAQTTEQTPEKRLPRGDPDRKTQGVFTWVLFQTLASNPGITYRQLAEEILRRYATDTRVGITPLFEGDLDSIVFAGDPADRIQQWQAQPSGESLRIDAGLIHGLSQGEKLAVLASPADPVDKAIGWVTVQAVDTFQAVLTPADGLRVDQIPTGAVVRKVADTVDFTLTVALPEPGSAPAEAMQAAVDAIEANPGLKLRVTFVPAGEPADIRLAVIPASAYPDAVWLLPATGMYDETQLGGITAIRTSDKTVPELALAAADSFAHIAKAVNLMRLGGVASDAAEMGVDVALTLAAYDPVADYADESTKRSLDTTNVPRLLPDDVVGAQLKNTSDYPIDYNVLYIGADYSITWLGNGRMHPGAGFDDYFLRVAAEDFGRERLVIILTPAKAGTATEDLSFLAQDSLPTVRDFKDDLQMALEEAGFGTTTRGVIGLRKKKPDDAPKATILQFELDTTPGNG